MTTGGDTFAIVDVSSWPQVAVEPGGADEKVWLEEPGTCDRWLFKPVVVKGHVQGEDWAEKLAAEFARILGVPCARVEMALRDGRFGAISRNLRPQTYELYDGAVLLGAAVPGYEPGGKGNKRRRGHNLLNIQKVLDTKQVPPDSADRLSGFSAFDVFSGVLVLDAWLANRDRHDQNWSVLLPSTEDAGPERLCGAYDQAGCLGFNETDERREALLAAGEVGRWAARGTAHRFENDGSPQSLVKLAADALSMCDGEASRYWLAQLEAVTPAQVSSLVERAPRMSDPARRFAVEILMVNRGRLLDECR